MPIIYKPGKRRFRLRQTAGDRIFGIINIAVLSVLTLITLLPVLAVALMSVTPMSDIQRNPNAFLIIPSYFTLNHYFWLFRGSSLLAQAYTVTTLRTLLGTAGCLLITALTAYPLSKKYLPGRNKIMLLFFFTMLFSGGIIPTYLVVSSLKLLNTFWALIIPSLLNVYNMIIMRTFFQGIPEEIDESARMDGASELTILFRIIMPLALPTLASIGLFYAVYHWNAFTDSIMYIGASRDLWPLQMLMREIVIMNNTGEMQLGGAIRDPNRPSTSVIISCTLIVSALPIMCVYPFVQRYFVKGLVVGALKG
ncbi:MAG: carbohydrate ABC transporter permease [Clostridiales bacterium]|jgi:ABC-type glycerol-3-phosphate transport system permease component|nr:carbohydrate ABC transporter permease [Clostridiales bacterium]